MAPSSSILMLSLVVVLIMAFFVLPSSSTSRHVLDHRQERYQTVKNRFRIDLKHIDSTKNFTKLQLVQRGIKRGQKRLQRLSAMTSVTSSENDELGSTVHAGSGEYLMSLSIGTPPMPYEAIMDTGSDLIWTQCKPCTDCYTQPTPIFDPTNSSSFSKLTCNNILCKSLSSSTCKRGGCEYLYAYGDYSMTKGVLATETFTFNSSSNQEKVSISQIGFGCGNDNEGSGFTQGAGLVGLGRGPLSLVSQIALGKFSYCLTSIDNARTSSLLLGSSSDLINNTKISENMTTSLIKNPLQPSFYYLSLEGITVGDTRLPIPKSTFSLRRNGSGGLIIDSGTTITYLEQAGFKLVKKAFVSQMGLPVADAGSTGLDLCFKLPSDTSDIEVPSLVFHFKDDVDLDLPGNNYMIGDLDAGLICLAMGASSGMSIFGNVQQQNMLIVHDLHKESLSFVPTKCDQL